MYLLNIKKSTFYKIALLVLASYSTAGCNKHQSVYNQLNKNGKKRGVWIEIFENENYQIATYRNNKLIGKVYGYSFQSNLNYILKYRNGKRQGWSYSYFGGSIIQACKYKNDSIIKSYNATPVWTD